MPETCTMMFEV